VRGTGGEHTPIVNGTIDISPSSRLFVSEGDIISSLYSGIKDIVMIDKRVASNLDCLSAVESNQEAEKSVTDDGEEIKILIKDEEEDTSVDINSKESTTVEADDDKRDEQAMNFVLVTNTDRDQEEREQEEQHIESMKEKVKSTKVCTSDRSMSSLSPRSLNVSPSPTLAITNE